MPTIIFDVHVREEFCADNSMDMRFYQGGVYVGDTEPCVQLNGSQLYNDLTTTHYWRCASSSIFTTIDTGQILAE